MIHLFLDDPATDDTTILCSVEPESIESIDSLWKASVAASGSNRVDIQHAASARSKNSSEKCALLLLDSMHCYSVPSSEFESSRLRSLDKLRFDIEAYLPVDAEDVLVASGHPNHSSRTVLATQASPIARIIEYLEGEGYRVTSVSPLCLAAVQAVNSKFNLVSSKQQVEIIVWGSTDGVWDGLVFDRGLLIDWNWLHENQVGDWVREVMDQSSVSTIKLLGPHAESIKKQLDESQTDSFVVTTDEQIDRACEVVDQVAARRLQIWFDFRRGQLKNAYAIAPIAGSIKVLLATCILGISSLLLLTIWKAIALNAQMKASEKDLVSVFQELYPGQRIPVDIPGRLTSEIKRLENVAKDLNAVPPLRSSLRTLSRFLSQLPSDAVFRIDSLVVDQDVITAIDGAVRSLDDFQTIVDSLKAGGFQFDPPGIKKMADGFSLRLERLRCENTDDQKAKSLRELASVE